MRARSTQPPVANQSSSVCLTCLCALRLWPPWVRARATPCYLNRRGPDPIQKGSKVRAMSREGRTEPSGRGQHGAADLLRHSGSGGIITTGARRSVGGLGFHFRFGPHRIASLHRFNRGGPHKSRCGPNVGAGGPKNGRRCWRDSSSVFLGLSGSRTRGRGNGARFFHHNPHRRLKRHSHPPDRKNVPACAGKSPHPKSHRGV